MDVKKLWEKLGKKLTNRQLDKINEIIFSKAVEVDHYNLKERGYLDGILEDR